MERVSGLQGRVRGEITESVKGKVREDQRHTAIDIRIIPNY